MYIIGLMYDEKEPKTLDCLRFELPTLLIQY